MDKPSETNVFVCHRPFHILRSCDMVRSLFKGQCNVLINFNMKKLGKKEYQEHFRSDALEKHFDKVILVNRNDFFGKWYSWEFRKYYKDSFADFSGIANSIPNVKSVFVFSDCELPVEILCHVFKEKTNAKIKIVDEGAAAYALYCKQGWKKNKYKVLISEFVSRILGYRINFRGYGLSSIYDESFACWPKLAIFRNPVYKLQQIDMELMSDVYNSLSLHLDEKRVIYVSNYVDSLWGVPKEFEFAVLKDIQTCCRDHGYELYIKPHPIQSNDYYSEFKGCLCDAHIPVEELMGEKTVVISPYSSALATAKALGLGAICISGFFGKGDVPLMSFFKKIGVEMADDMSMLSKMLFD